MSPAMFRKKPVVIRAMRFLDTTESLSALSDFMGTAHVDYADPAKPVLHIDTLEGRMSAQVGDWIIKGVKDEFYPCKPDIFDATYEPAE